MAIYSNDVLEGILKILIHQCSRQQNYFSLISIFFIFRISRNQLSMEYIPDGMSKEQWAKIKAKEAEANKGKNLGAIGITKFKSRSFEAWQKTGGEHLFPVDPSVPIDKRPYMQRPGGSPDGEVLMNTKAF